MINNFYSNILEGFKNITRKKSNCNNKYWSCRFIESGLVVMSETLGFCCANEFSNKVPMVIKWDGKRLPLQDINTLRENARSTNSTPSFSPCKGCIHWKYDTWKNEYVFDWITINHFLKCNIRCTYCDNALLPADFKENPPLLEPIFQELIEKRLLSPTSTIFFAGGEPTTLKEFDRLVTLLCNYAINLVIGTNATIYSPAIETELKQNKIAIVVSVDSGTRETYKKVKGKDFVDKVWQILRRYVNTGGDVTIKYIIMEENCHEIHQFVNCVNVMKGRKVMVDVNNKLNNYSNDIIRSIVQLQNECNKNKIYFIFGTSIYQKDLLKRIENENIIKKVGDNE
jgi:organic radical activating enzyme